MTSRVVGRIGLTVAIVGALLLVAPAPPATATSCAATASLSQAIAGGAPVFVGTVVSTTNRGRWATFAVEEVWSGDVSDTQVVKGGPAPLDDPNRFSSMGGEHAYAPGTRYVVDATRPAGTSETGIDDPMGFGLEAGDLQDGPCSATIVWSDGLAAQRPADARVIQRTKPIVILGVLPDPRRDGGTSGGHVGQALGVLAIVAITGVCLWLFFRRGSINDRARTDDQR